MGEVDLNQKIKQFLTSALNSIATKDYEQAIEELKSAESLDSSNPEILYNLGVSYCKSEQLDMAITSFKKLLQLPFTFIDIITVNKLLAYALILSGELDQSIKYIHDVLKLIPSDTTLLNMLGYCYDQEGNYQDAIKVYHKIVDIDKHNYNAYNSLAFITAKIEGDMNLALRYAKTALESNPESPAYLDTIGYIYLKRGNLELAKNNLKLALSKFPNSLEIKDHINQLLKLDTE